VQPAYVQVAGQLRDLIVQGELSPGQRLPVESDLSAMFRVSRSTVREALRTLASEQLVDTRRGVRGGTFVVEPEAEQLGRLIAASLGLLSGASMVSVDEMLDARQLLEVPAARLAASRGSEAQIEAIRATLSEPLRDNGAGDLFHCHRDFHVAVLAAAQNRLLQFVTTPIFAVLENRYERERIPRRFWAEVTREHDGIFVAIDAHDEEQAGALMSDHLGRLRSVYHRIDRTQPIAAAI
jgi:DNA-binding FadR family transcriptional regulator